MNANRNCTFTFQSLLYVVMLTLSIGVKGQGPDVI